MQDLFEVTHFLTRLKVAPGAEGFFDGGSGEAKRAAEMAAELPVSALTRAWQVLLRGLIEVRDAARPIAAAEMALIRLAYAADLPPTDKLVRDLLEQGAHGDPGTRPRLALRHRSPSGGATKKAGGTPASRELNAQRCRARTGSAAQDADDLGYACEDLADSAGRKARRS